VQKHLEEFDRIKTYIHTYSFNRGWHTQPNRKLYIDKEKSHWRWNYVEWSSGN